MVIPTPFSKGYWKLRLFQGTMPPMKTPRVSLLTIGAILFLSILIGIIYVQPSSAQDKVDVSGATDLTKQPALSNVSAAAPDDRYFMFISEPNSEAWQLMLSDPSDRRATVEAVRSPS